MYSQQDIDDAVTAGAISRDNADKLRAYVAAARSAPAVDEEHFRLILGFNDIFVSIASIILLVAVTWIGQSFGESAGLQIAGDGPSPIAGLFGAIIAWGLATYFTAKRRMALPSIVLLWAFVGGVFMTSLSTLGIAVVGDNPNPNEAIMGVLFAISAAITACAAWYHWKKFRVPITVAAGAAAACGIVVSLIVAALANGGMEGQPLLNTTLGIVLALGLGVFAFAMRWDSSDPARITRRSDVAFWLHLLAAVMIVHPVFTLLGLRDGNATLGEGFLAVGLYVALGFVALAIDRRAMLVSALAYVLWAMSDIFKQFGAVELNVALTALVIGSALLMLSAFWHQARVAVVTKLPASMQTKLPNLAGTVKIEASPEPAA